MSRRARGRIESVARNRPTDETANTRAGPPTAVSTPASAGPSSVPAPSIVPDATLAAVSWSGVVATSGSSADCTGRVIVMAVAVRVASAYTTGAGAPVARASAAAAIAPVCRTYAVSSTRLREKRSPSVPAAGAMTTDGTSWMKATNPASAAPPRPYA